MTHLDDTIVALSSAPGSGARAIVRLSGQLATTIIEQVSGSSIARQRGRCEIEVRLSELPPVPITLHIWIAPQSYTGQDLVELHTLGCPPLVERLIAALLEAGARAAGPGEFTMRGFLAGKLDLTRAEAVQGVIAACDRAELKQALGQLAGGITRPLDDLRDDLLNLLADVEAGLDFSDEDLEFVDNTEMLKRITKALALVTTAGKQLDQRSLGERPFRAVLAGRPNAGKSSLFNALADKRAALVSPEPGTTRDYLVQRLDLNGVPMELLDTAGWQPSNGSIEQQAQSHSREQTHEADLILLCVPVTQGLANEESKLIETATRPVLVVWTQCDRGAAPPGEMATSAVTGLGLEPLRRLLAERIRRHHRPALAPSLSRCRHHIAVCLEHLRRAHHGVLFHDPPEILALELRGGLDQLGEMVGAVYTDDLLDRIFSRFCIGK